jgi:hypothetical protein
MSSEPAPPPAAHAAPFDLLKRPEVLLQGLSGSDGWRLAAKLGLSAGLATAAYGAAAGCFLGGGQVALALAKVPLVVFGSLALTAPSFFVFACLAGADIDARRAAKLLSAFGAMLGLLLVGLLPIAWLFSVSSRSVTFVTWVHLLAWVIALFFGRRLLTVALPGRALARTLTLWSGLLLLVSLQMTTLLRPTLERDPGRPFFESSKLFFVSHYGSLDSKK